MSYAARLQERTATLAELSRSSRAGVDFRETLHELLNFPTTLTVTSTGDANSLSHQHSSSGAGKSTRDAEQGGQGILGVLSTAKTALALYSDPLVARTPRTATFAHRSG